MPEKAQADRDRERSRREPDPQVGVAPAVERRLPPIVPRLRELPQQWEVARRPPQCHQHEHRDHHHGRAVDAEIGAVAEHSPVEELARADPDRDRGDERAEPDQRRRHTLPAARAGEHVDDGQQRRRTRLFGECRRRHAEPGCDPATATREEDRRRHRRQHEHLEVRRLPVLRRERDHRENEEDPGDPSRAIAVPAPRLDREQQRGERDREHRDDTYGPQRGGAEKREGRRVDVRHERRLAVDRVLVELAAVADHLRLCGDERLVGVEHRDEERGHAEHEGDSEQDQEHPRQLAPRRPGGARLEREVSSHRGVHAGGTFCLLTSEAEVRPEAAARS